MGLFAAPISRGFRKIEISYSEVPNFILIIVATAVGSLLLFFGGLYPYLNLPAYGLVALGGLLGASRSLILRKKLPVK